MGKKIAMTEPSFREMEHYLFLNDIYYFLRTIGKVMNILAQFYKLGKTATETDQEFYPNTRGILQYKRNLFTQATDQSFPLEHAFLQLRLYGTDFRRIWFFYK